MKEFDTAKGAFLLVAVVIATMMAVVLISVSVCTYLTLFGGSTGSCTSLQEFTKELIQMSFTAAIAFAGGRMSAPTAPRPKLPENDK